MAHADRKQISLFVTDDQLEKLNKYSKKIGISRQNLLENIIKGGLDDIGVLNKCGIIAVGVGLRDLAYKIRHKEIDPSVLSGSEDTET